MPHYFINNVHFVHGTGESHGCGGVLNASSGTFQSLDYDNDGKYESGLDCVWVIMAPPTKIIRITFQRFDVEKPDGSDHCPWDSLEV